MSHQKEEAPIRPYEADGIQELDNNLPTWWVGLFTVCVGFAIIYMVYLHALGGKTLQQEYELSVAAAKTAPGGGGAGGESDLNALIGNAEAIQNGKDVFIATCAACHGQVGEGNIGPNLTDKFWIHGGKPESIYNTISNGFAEKGMPAWGPILGEKKVKQLTAFVVSLKGTTPPNGKAPQGDPEQ